VVAGQSSGAGQGAVALDPIQATDQVVNGDHVTLTLHRQGRQPWAPGHYVIAVRGGDLGIKTIEGDPVWPSSVFYLIAQGKDLTDPANIGLIRAQSASEAEALAKAQQLNAIIGAYKANGAFAAVNTVFPQQELATLVTFAIAPAPTQVQLDPGRGLVPLPIDLLRFPGPGGKLTPLAACTLASGHLDAAGVCRDANGNVNGAAAGFAALDGFSTTGAMLAPTSDLVDARTVKGNVHLYDLSNPAAPVEVSPTTYIAEPCEFTSTCASSGPQFSPVVALQPAGATAGDPLSVFNTRPLKDRTDYAVVITDGVKDKAGNPLAPGTVAKILLFDNPLVVNGTSQLSGIDNNTAGALEVMRNQLKPVVAVLGGKAHIAMAYTFRTQSILPLATQLGALPYTQAAATAAPGAVTPAPGAATATAAFVKYGVDRDRVPHDSINEVLETTITTFNLLDPATGAFSATGAGTPETIRVLIATPRADNPKVLACSGPLAALGQLGLKCAPMMIYRHGLGDGRADMLTLANTFADEGMVTVAIDAAKHGDRSFCSKGSTTTTVGGTTVPVCADGAACVSQLPAGAQGDAAPPGACTAGFRKRPVSPSCFTGGNCDGETDGIPFVSGNFLVSANFFRTRDTLRQDIVDQSQLVRALAFVPTGAPPSGNNVFDRMALAGVIIDPTRIFFSAQSLGSMQGAVDVAANPRISRAAFNVGGGTAVDIFATSPAFAATTNQLLAGLGIFPGTSAYLQFLVVAKTILDPADPLNFVSHLQSNTLPNLLANPNGSVAQDPKPILTQIAFCDQVIPNPFNLLFASTGGTGPLPNPATPGNGFGGPGTFQLFFRGTSAPSASDLASCPPPGGSPLPPGAVPHGFITDWSHPLLTHQAQLDAARFVTTATPTQPNSLVVLP
jgi:hypothetical protein